ncbi:MerR family transcriptional regulator [Streptomyces atratus]
MATDPDSAPRLDDPGGAALSTGAVARRLGVAATTLRARERRYAMGPVTRTDGKHCRRTPEDISRLEEMCRLTAEGVPPRRRRASRSGVRPARRTRVHTSPPHPPPRPRSTECLRPAGVPPCRSVTSGRIAGASPGR